MLRKRSVWVALFMVLALVMSACSSSKAPEPGKDTKPPVAEAKPKIMTIGIWSAPDSFSPITYTTTYSSVVNGVIYPSMYVMNDKLDFEPRLAESYTANDKQDVWTFKLRKNAKWTDGKPITADDVLYTFQVIAHPDTPTTRRSLIDTIKGLDNSGISLTKDFNVEGIKVIDANTIEFTTKAPVAKDAFLEKVGGLVIMPKHVLEPDVKANLKGLDKAAHVMKPTVFGGPYKLVEYKTDSHVELAPNPDYFLGKPKLDKLFYKIVGQATFAAALEKGEIDVAGGQGIGEVPVADWDKVSALSTLDPVTYVAPSFQYMDVNENYPGFPELKNPKIREALAHAINRPLIVQRLLKGKGEVLNTPINSASKYYNKGLQAKLEYDPAKAKQMLKDNGWDFNKEIIILTPTGNVVREQSADIIMANLQEVGMKVKIEKVDFATRQARAKKGEYIFSLVGFSSSFDPDISSQTSTKAGFNYSGYSNPAMDKLNADGKLVVKFEDKKAHYDKVQEQFVADVPMLPLYAVQALTAVNKRVIAAKPGPNGLTWNAYLWDVK